MESVINMLKLHSVLLAVVLHSTAINAEDSSEVKRFGLGGIPILAFDPDLGLRYGAVLNLFDYGKDNQFPDYSQYLNIKMFNSTKGTSNISSIFETDKLLPKSTVYLEASFIKDLKLDFFGFNGVKSIVNTSYIDAESPFFLSPYYYSYMRKLVRVRADWHKPIGEGNWKILLGVNRVDYEINDKTNKQLHLEETMHGNAEERVRSLYSQYVEWGVIKPAEADGGSAVGLMSGIAYDTRNNRINCTEGIWFETYLVGFKGSNYQSSFGKHIMTFRQYLELPARNSVFTWRISSQQKVFGAVPFYMLPTYFDTRFNQDGIGGAFTLRGVMRNRIVANGYVLANAEWRQKIWKVQLFGLNWEFEASAFSDFTYVTQEYDIALTGVPDSSIHQYFATTSSQKPLISMGMGAYLIYNKNNITSVNVGWSPHSSYGTVGLYVGSAFLF